MTRLNFQVSFFYGRVASSELADLASLFRQCLSRTKDRFCRRGNHPDFGLFGVLRLYLLTSVLKTKAFFSNFLWRKGNILVLMGLANHLAFFLLPLFPPVMLLEWPAFPFYVHGIIGHGVQVAFDLHSDLDSLFCSTGCEELSFVNIILLAASLWGLFAQTLKGRGIDLTFPLSVAYHVTI